MKPSVVLVLDCGATNVRAMAVDSQGTIVARAVVANATQAAAENPGWLQWSLDAILSRFARCCQQLPLDKLRPEAICVTTFGVDGALVDSAGQLLYPIISWKCPRTLAVMGQLEQRLPLQTLRRITGVGQYAFNTIYKLFWLQQHHPELVRRAHCWLFISSLINQRLTGQFTTDITMAGTSQLFDLRLGQFSEQILNRLGLSAALFPPLVHPGERIGELRQQAAAQLGLPPGIPVIACGHDTQFALFGAGAGVNQAVLSSGTWEILMVRSGQVDSDLLASFPQATCEIDSAPGLYNPGMQWLAGGVLEWIRGLFWSPQTPWADIVTQAAAIPPGCEGVRLRGDLFTGANQAGWAGVSTKTRPAHFYRAALEGLALQLRDNLRQLEQAAGFSANELLLVGGGSRNALWNQLKADLLQRPVRVLDDAETTVLGAALYGWQGAGLAASAEQAREKVAWRYREFSPDPTACYWQESTC